MKIALIKKHDSSFWRSCQSITENLLKAYEKFCVHNKYDLEVFSFKSGANSLESFDLVKKIYTEKFDTVVWLDHYPHPATFIKAYYSEHEKNKNNDVKIPHFVFHLFGDFVLQAPLWLEVQKEIDKQKAPQPLSFICASHKQKKLVDSLLKNKNAYSCDVMPFPVDEEKFNFKEESRLRMRAQLGLSDNETAIVYTGRLSHQKNIIDLIYGFSQYQKNLNPRAKLFLSGPMDDLGVPYLGKEALDGTFFFHWEEALRENKDLVDNNMIQFLGNLDHEELCDLYSAADIFTSLSCHNDEDYGMSPAEALCCGLPCLLSDWGGYASFKIYCDKQVRLVPVVPGETRHEASKAALVKGLVAHETTLKKTKRVDNATEAHKHLGVEAVAKSLVHFYEKNHVKNVSFPGFNEQFYKLCALFENNSNAPFRGPTGGFSLFYKEFYSCYWDELNIDKKESR